MKASIVVLTHNRLAALRECLVRIYANTVDRETEVIVIENGCVDSSGEWLDTNAPTAPLETRVIHLPENVGVSGRNEGIKVARGKYILQCDDDSLVMAGWDAILTEPMEDDHRIGGAGQEGFYQQASWERARWSAGLIDDRRRPQVGDYCDLLMGFTWAFRNERVGDKPRFLYDPALSFWHEETLLQIEIRAVGYRLLKTRAVANHRSLPHIRSADEDAEMAERSFEYVKNKWQNDPRLKFEGALVGLR